VERVNGFCFVSVPEKHGCLMEHILQNVIPGSKDVTDAVDVCRKRPLLDVQKLFAGAAPSDMDRKWLAYLVYNKQKQSFLMDIKKILKTSLSTYIPRDTENDKPFLHLPMITHSEMLKFCKESSVQVPVSPIIDYFKIKIKQSIVPVSQYMNSITEQRSEFPKFYDTVTVKDNTILRKEIEEKYQHPLHTSYKLNDNQLASTGAHHADIRSSHLKSTKSFLDLKASHLFFNSVSKMISLLMKRHRELPSTFTKESNDHLNYSKGDSGHSSISTEASLWRHILSPSCDPQNLSCRTEVLQPRTKRSSGLSSELDKEFAHLPEAALKFLFYSPVSCPSGMNEPLIHQVDSRILNSLSVQPSWLPYQPKEPVGGCPTQLWPHTNPDRIWPRILLTAKCVCDGSRCALHGTHRCVTIKVAVVSLIRGTREGRDQARNVWRQWEMVAIGCVCAEHKSVLLHEHRPHIYI
jgi:hypothetical protein